MGGRERSKECWARLGSGGSGEEVSRRIELEIFHVSPCPHHPFIPPLPPPHSPNLFPLLGGWGLGLFETLRCHPAVFYASTQWTPLLSNAAFMSVTSPAASSQLYFAVSFLPTSFTPAAKSALQSSVTSACGILQKSSTAAVDLAASHEGMVTSAHERVASFVTTDMQVCIFLRLPDACRA